MASDFSPRFACPVQYKYISRFMSKDSGHRGDDLHAAEGTEIYAAADGVVLAAQEHYSWGNFVEIDHGTDADGLHWVTLYAHMKSCAVQVGQTVTAGDVNDSVPYLDLMEQIHTNVVPIQSATADAAYDFPLAHRVLGELGIDFFVRPQKTAARVSVQFTRDDFYRDENRDVYLCPGGKELRLKRLARSASGLFWEYQADQRDCALCPLRDKCLREDDKRGARKVSVSYFAADRQRNLERRYSPEYRDALKLRQVWCEGSFSAQKREHNLARILRRGLEAAEDHCLLSATALNLKRMIKHAG